jgi:pimeloyl-ACP methyl ester carboxylesterase
MPYLTSRFQPATYSRHQHGLSTPLLGTSFLYLNPVQQARDLLAVSDALGFGNKKLYLFSSSGGGIIALKLAAMHPERIAHFIAHETPCACLLPDCEKLINLLFDVYPAYISDGAGAGYNLFLPRFPGYDGLPRLGGAVEGDEDRFLKYEHLPLSIYTPDLRRVKESGVSIAFTYGKLSRDASFVRPTIELASVLGCHRHLVPGNHTGFRYVPEAFAKEILKIFGGLEEKERMRSVQLGF